MDKKTGKNILQWPVEEVDSLRLSKGSVEINDVKLAPGALIQLALDSPSQVNS